MPGAVSGRKTRRDGKTGRTRLALVVFEQLHGFEGGGAGEELVREFRRVLFAVVDLAVGFFGVSWAVLAGDGMCWGV